MESQGIEASLSVDVIRSQDANLNIFGNFAYIDREVKDLKGVERVGAGGGLPVGTGVNIGYHAVGHQPYAAWVFRQLYDADGNPVYNAFADLNGDNQITNDDRYFRNFRPDFTFGFGMNLSYKSEPKHFLQRTIWRSSVQWLTAYVRIHRQSSTKQHQ